MANQKETYDVDRTSILDTDAAESDIRMVALERRCRALWACWDQLIVDRAIGPAWVESVWCAYTRVKPNKEGRARLRAWPNSSHPLSDSGARKRNFTRVLCGRRT